jgi:glycerol-3-phosphate O-acyltransferase/dihydroxyacetone phosphate acyltransferase
MIRPLLDRMLYGLAVLAARGLFRTVEVVGLERLPRDRPVLLVANHFNGAVDALMLVAALHRFPRFVAKATLWNVLPARPFLALAGLVPVHRPEDQRGVAGNAETFARAAQVLRKGRTLALFPEGTTHDRLELARLRTGAARIALGARAAGIERIAIVPVGLTYEDKLAVRSRALVRVGKPIDLDSEFPASPESADQDGPEARDAVRRLTERIGSRLAQVTPRYASPLERSLLGMAAEIRLRGEFTSPGALVPLSRREPLAQALARAPAEVRTPVLEQLGVYNLYLDVFRLRDDQLVPRVGRRYLLTRALRLTLYVGVLGIVMVIGAAVNLLPALAVTSAGRRPAAPVTKGTVRMLVGIVVFPAVWIAVAVALPVTGALPTTLAVLAWPLAGAITIGGVERAVRLVQAWTGWVGFRNARGAMVELFDARRRLSAAVDHGLDTASEDAAVIAALRPLSPESAG